MCICGREMEYQRLICVSSIVELEREENQRCILEGGDIGGIPEMHLWEGGGVLQVENERCICWRLEV
jgi:hypothetical protein